MSEEEVEQGGVSKLVIKNLPYEATVDDVCKFFGVDQDSLELPRRPNSNLCKGIAFLSLEKDEDVEKIRKMDGTEFNVGENARDIEVTDFEHRERRPRNNKRRGRGNNRRGRGDQRRGNQRRGGRNQRRGGRQNDNEEQDGGAKPVYEQSEESQREVYVSNVPWKAEQDDIKKHFADCGEIEAVTIPKLYASGRPKGFAFVRFKTKKGREEALKLHESELFERKIGVRENKGRATNTVERVKKEPRTGLSEKQEGCKTIYVGNLPWTTNEEELNGLFKDCGKITSSRIVRQSWTQKSRGFGYVEFEDTDTVDKAVKLKLTCQDRELRLDYAEQIN